ncbi:hypothetical protein [Nocardia colli]
MGTNPDYPKQRVLLPNGMYVLIYEHRKDPVIKFASKHHRLVVESMHGQDRWDNPRGSDVILRAETIESPDAPPNREHPDDWVCVRRRDLEALRRRNS